MTDVDFIAEVKKLSQKCMDEGRKEEGAMLNVIAIAVGLRKLRKVDYVRGLYDYIRPVGEELIQEACAHGARRDN